MKKNLFLIVFLFTLQISLFAQGFYFDIGLGGGSAKTEIDGEDVSKTLSGSGVDEMGALVGLKFGYGPIAGNPLYIVGELSGVGHRFEDSINYIQFNSYLIGPGVIYYPHPLFQLGASIGFSFVSNDTDLPFYFYDSESGSAWNIYGALDLGRKNHGFLIGLKYFRASNELEVSGAEQVTSFTGIFIKYAYRNKIR